MSRWSAGFTLIELVMVVVIIGILAAFGYPLIRNSTEKGGLTAGVDAIAALHARARQSAIARGRPTWLIVDASGGRVWVEASTSGLGSGRDTVGRIEDLRGKFGVTLYAAPESLQFTPRGFGANPAGGTIVVTKGSLRDTLTVSGAGRMMR